jgi:hypothetical protein
MTAPGQEPDEVITAEPGGKPDPTESLNLNAVGDNHMPEDVREAVREEARAHDAESGGAETGGAETGGDEPSEPDDSDGDET